MKSEELIGQAVKLFSCDQARIASFPGKHYLILGWKRRTKPGEWTRDGKPIRLRYVHEQVVASGKTLDALWACALEYKRVQGLTMREYLAEKLPGLTLPPEPGA